MSRMYCGHLLPDLWLLLAVTSVYSPFAVISGAMATAAADVRSTNEASTPTTTQITAQLRGLQARAENKSASKTRSAGGPTSTITSCDSTSPMSTLTSADSASPTSTLTPADSASPTSTLTPADSASTSSATTGLPAPDEEPTLDVTESTRHVVSHSSEASTELSAFATSSTHEHSTITSTETAHPLTDTSAHIESSLGTTTTISQNSSTIQSNISESNTTQSTFPTDVPVFTNGTTESVTTSEVIPINETTANTTTPTTPSPWTHFPEHTTETTQRNTPEAHNSTKDPPHSGDSPSTGLSSEAEIAIIVVVSAATAAILIVVIVWYLRRIRRPKKTGGYITDADYVSTSVSIGDFTMHGIDLDE